MQESYWRLIWCICICCMHSHSQGFKGYCETKRIIPVIPREPGLYQEKVNDVAHFSSLHFSLFMTLSTFHDYVSHGPFPTGVLAASSVLEAD